MNWNWDWLSFILGNISGVTLLCLTLYGLFKYITKDDED